MRTISALLLLLSVTVECKLPRRATSVAHAQGPERLGPDVIPPRAIVGVNPPYPQYSDTARRLRIEGTVTVEAVIHKDGSISVVGTKERLGYGLDENAVLALRHMRFQPATKSSEPVDVAVDIPVDFRLDDVRENQAVVGPSFVRPPACTSIKSPQPVFRIQPQYTEIAKKDKVTGVVSLDVIVRADGSVDVSRVAESLDHGLDSAAVDAVSQWVFSPRICDGKTADTPLKLEVNFNLR